MDMRISTETGKPMLLGLGTAEKNSGLVMLPACLGPERPFLLSLSFVLTHSNLWIKNGLGGNNNSDSRHRISNFQWKRFKIL